jgi:large subunit ribosomal protein L31
MKEGIHPKYLETTVVCACGNSWQTRSTRLNLRTDVCSKCHPFYTGEQRIIDTAGQVDRFMRRLQNTETRQADQKRRLDERSKVPPKKSLLKEIYGEEE